MSVLIVDIGNTRIKWALWRDGRLGPMRAAAHDGWSPQDYARQVLGKHRPSLGRVVVASVASASTDRRFVAATRRVAGRAPEFMATSRSTAGVTTRYTDPWRLGVDRFAGVIGAHQLLPQRAVCVLNAGTTVTVDLVDARGIHRGGAILPGPDLMMASLLNGTAGIARRAREAGAPEGGSGARTAGAADPFARSTRSAIRQGAFFAVAAAIDRIVTEAREAVGAEPVVLAAGGGLTRFERLLRSRYIRVNDLVLRGIAAHAGLEVSTPAALAKAVRARR
ncbi:MAG: type III pantothenate kinase [Steroidobacteraceae bacterium]